MFCSFCESLKTNFESKNTLQLTLDLTKFESFLNVLPQDFFEDFSPILKYGIPTIILDCIQPNKSFNVCYNAIALLGSLIYACKNITPIFCTDDLLKLICSHIIQDSSQMRSEFLWTLANIMLESPIEIHHFIYSVFPISKFSEFNLENISSQNSGQQLIRSSIFFFVGATMYPLQENDIQYIMKISHLYFEMVPLYCVLIFTNFIKIQNILTGFDLIHVQHLLNFNDEDVIIGCCKFIAQLSRRTSLEILFDLNRLLFIGLQNDNFSEMTKKWSLIALRRIIERDPLQCQSIDIDLILSSFPNCSSQIKCILGFIICIYSKNVTIQKVAFILEGSTNLFMVARELFELSKKDLSIELFSAMSAVFRLGERRPKLYQRCTELFFHEFPESSIWDFINVNDEDVEHVGEEFVHSFFENEENNE